VGGRVGGGDVTGVGGEVHWRLTTLGFIAWQAPLLASCRTWLCNAFDCWLEH